MKLKELVARARYRVVAVMDGADCPAETFIDEAVGEAAQKASRTGLKVFLEYIAQHGLNGLPPAWCHCVDKNEQIYELIKGDLRLFFFQGAGDTICVCTHGGMKKGQKVNPKDVRQAAQDRFQYRQALKTSEIEIVAKPKPAAKDER
jgi:hypothetical protein